MSDSFLDGNLVYLRLPDIERDVVNGDWYRWFNSDEITKYLYHGVYPNSLERQIEIVKSNLERGDTVLLSVIDRESEKLCGVVSLKDIDLINRVAEVTIVMSRGDYVKNAPLEALALITQYGFEKLNLAKINGGHHIGLWRWVNKVELLGYRLEGYIRDTHRRYGRVFDSVRVGVRADDYFRNS